MRERYRAAGRLLVADDNKVNRLLLTRTLELLGHTVATAANGRLALEMLQRESFDLMLLDMEMPEMDGFTVLEHLGKDDAAARPPGDRHLVPGRHRARRALHRAGRGGLPSQAGEPRAAEGAHRRQPREEAAARPAEGDGAALRDPEVAQDLQESGLLARRAADPRLGDVLRHSRLHRAGRVAAARGDDRAAQHLLHADVRCDHGDRAAWSTRWWATA